MPDLPKRTLGRTGLEVTTLGFGAMELRGAPRGPKVSDEEGGRVLNAVLDAGINFIDTSIDYGKSEELIGRYVSHRRSEFFLASKCGCLLGHWGEHVHTAAVVREGVENSLRLMKTDYLDVVQFHMSVTRAELEGEGALQEALKLKEEGKVRFVGMSGRLPNLPEQIDMGVFDTFQVPYSALQRDNEAEIARASAAGAGIIIRGGAARGGPSDWQPDPIRMASMPTTEEMQGTWEKAGLDGLLDGMSRMEFTLRFTLSNPDLDTTIVGTRSPEHLEANVAVAAKGPLPEDVVAEAKRRLEATGSRPA